MNEASYTVNNMKKLFVSCHGLTEGGKNLILKNIKSVLSTHNA